MSSDCSEPHPQNSSTHPRQALDEFSLIERFFDFSAGVKTGWPSQGLGDDCAFLDIGNSRIAVTVDMMALSTHFLNDADPYFVGRKSLAVNLSDLAAAGASPRAFFLSLSLPWADAAWLEEYSRGLRDISEEYDCPLRGGDTVKAPIVNGEPGKTAMSITALGELPRGMGLSRSGACVQDDIWVSGTPGDAFAALSAVRGELSIGSRDFEYFKSRMDNPVPRVMLGEKLLGKATACCDVSDGLAGDLKHILDRSGVSAVLFWENFPRSEAMDRLPEKVQQRCVLNGGDDYELLFTAPQNLRSEILEISGALGLPLSNIGRIERASEPFRILDAGGDEVPCGSSFNHFG